MPRTCNVKSCRATNKDGVSLHSLPIEPDRRGYWIRWLGNSGEVGGGTVFICSRHFSPSSYVSLPPGVSGKPFLAPDAVPSVRGSQENVDVCMKRPSTCSVATQVEAEDVLLSTGTEAESSASQDHNEEPENVYICPTCHQPAPASQASITPTQSTQYSEEFNSQSTEEYIPSELDPSPEPRHERTDEALVQEPKYIVFRSELHDLFSHCPHCQVACEVSYKEKGTFLKVNMLCPHCGYSKHWNSQPLINQVPTGNILLSERLGSRTMPHFKSHTTDDPVIKYVLDHSLRLHPAQEKLMKVTKEHPWSIMLGDPIEMQLLQMLCKTLNAKKTLDVGVFTGYSALSVALALPDDGKVVACDINDEYANIGKPFWKEAGVDHKIDLRIAPAAETLESLIANGESGTYDFAFIDADKVGYLVYYEHCLKLVRKGGIIAFDNTIWGGRVADTSNNEEMTVWMRDVNKALFADDRIDISFLPVGDGTTLCRIK